MENRENKILNALSLVLESDEFDVNDDSCRYVIERFREAKENISKYTKDEFVARLNIIIAGVISLSETLKFEPNLWLIKELSMLCAFILEEL
ncbi:hypothetical protein [Helicobacter sp. MIT 05-5294]|uniref:hypothetical protein n=1 Tax=Helicobacter sp. MIT 05-5294 TaxID=1548150 RepID=UPI000A6F94DF|nr:hypothetical protein [Helicobacter sp. MIT 05-5294]TLD85801.1 hypothetical protein LS69_007855 [Helicobacter sp. MIT 05-5294]